jgi:hypothetical protein
LTKRFVEFASSSERILRISFQLRKANISEQPKLLLSVLCLNLLGNFSIFLFFVWCNNNMFARLGESLNVVPAIMLLNFINTITYTAYVTIYQTEIFVVHHQFFILRKFSISMLESQGDLVWKMKATAQIWDTICDGIDAIAFCYTINTIYYILCFTFNFAMFIHSIISYVFYENSTDVDLIYMCMIMAWTVLFSPTMIYIFFVVKGIDTQRRMIEKNVHSLVHAYSQRKLVMNRAELLLLQFEHRQPKITCGVFEIDWKLLFCLLGTSYSYLLIIAQFELKL